MKDRKWVLYLGTTYYCDSDRLHSPQLTCIGPSLDDVHNYLSKIRHLPVVDPSEPIALPDQTEACATVTAAVFPSQAALEAYAAEEERQPFIMQEHFAALDHRMAGTTKKISKNVLLPQVVIDVMERTADQFRISLAQCQHTLKEFFYYINGGKSPLLMVDEDSRKLQATIALLEQSLQQDGYRATNGIYKRHPILFCSEREYRSAVTSELRMQELDRQYRDQMMDPRS